MTDASLSTLKKGRKMRIANICICIFIIIVLTPILLNYIPVKFAISIEDAKKKAGNNGYYLCETNLVDLDIGWFAKSELNPHLKYGTGIRVKGLNPEKYLSGKIFDFKWYETYNQFLLFGDFSNLILHKDTVNVSAELNVIEWQIIYPIRRDTWWSDLAPQGYLTVYDYDWIKTIKSFWQ